MTFLDRVLQPPRTYTPIPFWFLNGDLRHEELRRQLRDFADHHVYGVVLHPRIGLSRRIGYLSPRFFRYLRTAVETAKELDMKVVFYDEGMYPSGSACGQVVQGHPEYASRGLALTGEALPGDRVLAETPEGLLVERFSGGTIRGIHYGEDDGEPDAPPSADLLCPEAVERFVTLTHEAYYRAFAPYFGSTVIGFFTDEPSILGRNAPADLQPWTAGFAEIFQAAGGQLSGLTALFRGEENADTALYRRLILQRESEVYYGRLSRWCAEHGVALMGHPHQSDDIAFEQYFQIPGQDLVYRWVSPERGDTEGMDSVMGKCSADMAHWMGRQRNANECFGACNRNDNPWYFTGADMKWFIDYLAFRGVNLFIPHAFYYSLKGQRSAERPPDVGPGSPWWPYYTRWADYMTRVSCLMAETEALPAIAVPCRNREMPWREVAPLFQSQRGFRYLPESLWSEAVEKDGRLTVRGRVFDAVLGPADMWPSVSHDPMQVAPDVRCAPACPALRAVRLYREGEEGWFLVNAGDEPLTARVTLPTDRAVFGLDLWSGRRRTFHEQVTTEGRCLTVRLAPRESLLLWAGEAPEHAGEELLASPDSRTLHPSAFRLAGEDRAGARKIYLADIPGGETDYVLILRGEEMAELYLNDRLVDVAFWAPQVFLIPAAALPKGPAGLKLIFTGSRANIYGEPVRYGLNPL